MTTGATKPDWDTPPDGDFAAYVERLTAQAPLQKARAAQASAAATNGAVQSSKASAPATSLPQVLPPDVLQLMQPLAGVLRTVRSVLLVMMVLHGIALFLLGRGSLPGLVVMGAVWWGLGWLMQSAAQAGGAQAPGGRAGMESLQDRLRQMAQQRSGTGIGTGKKKP
ncbi:hypothetical protein C8C95_3476 [Acidovorax sp. 99]|uniref:hypothetical protein n=1 Tax=unclassified Acidovorax TaxID=2684926 RepID=UPI000D5F1D4E|nr:MULTISPECIES: hypothetical protein [unclassified Acidovorax]PVY92604.1 hypothetical protein C8C95_3476 [Acidovorax sp. 99]